MLWTGILITLCLMVETSWAQEMENRKLFQGDIVLDKDDVTSSYSASMKGGRWKNGVVPYIIHDSLQTEAAALRAIKAAIADYHKYTCIRFVPRNGESEYVQFTFDFGCSSPVGWKKYRVNKITLGKHCWLKGKVMHEMGHTMGFWHEQSRPDRDEYVEILWKNIKRGDEYNFNKYSSKEIDPLGAPYDLESIMHYSTALFTKNGRRTIKVKDYSKRMLIGNLDHFSEIDIKQLNKMYNCPVYKGTFAPKVCEDSKRRNCGYYKSRGYCTNVRTEHWMYEVCCKTCFGYVAGKGPHTWPQTGMTTVAPITVPGKCKDKSSKSDCEYWARLGNCESKQKAMKDFMQRNCCATCYARGHH